MGCYRCGTRQVDPLRGPSRWKRGVRGGEQVLICPDCQAGGDWTTELDHCAACSSTSLVRMLGATHCRGCGAVDDTTPGEREQPARVTDEGFRDEVEAALERVLRPRSV